MAELEMPTLNLGRYLDLVKRRRWQLLPAAVLGLAVGLVVAWMIPRYYEADTSVRINYLQVADQSKTTVDPMLQEIKKARQIIASTDLVMHAVKELRGYDFQSDVELARYAKAATQRIVVADIDPGVPGRSSAILSIKFRDQDRKHSADMANKLRDLYLEREFGDIEQREKRMLEELNDKIKRVEVDLDLALQQRSELQKKEDIDLGAKDPKTNQPVLRLKTQELEAIKREMGQVEGAISGLKTQIESRRKQLPAEKELEQRAPIDPVDLQALQEREARLQTIQATIQGLLPSNPNRATWVRMGEALEAEIDQIRARIDARSPLAKVMNPAYLEVQQKIDDLAAELAGREKVLEKLQEQATELKQQNVRMPDIIREWERLSREIAKGEDDLKRLWQQRTERQAAYDALTVQRDTLFNILYPASLPLEPTYPNKTVIAMLGAALGLGTLVGLVFLLDVLQSTFKSFDEVGRALPVPTLGGISFLELEADLRAARARRVRLAMTVTLVFAMVAAVLVIYFVDPVRLPSWLRDLLGRLLDRGPVIDR